jgi:hypothetical protein
MTRTEPHSGDLDKEIDTVSHGGLASNARTILRIADNWRVESALANLSQHVDAGGECCFGARADGKRPGQRRQKLESIRQTLDKPLTFTVERPVARCDTQLAHRETQ